ncbi:Pimeloyl-ACP methyl ester carboxylesterase [Streptoalloteichus tenebrarius]|uniref:Pimeloyl-ACP methyl ester carboxylesterase n=1 Tax=Streptoalloteichus tenebrarius (strain ATCC 17920 / DSM 40477 / JCM 4838 / CBS 697.72 / NBRC 16177 / NCIMB 11028 / NRRL B-12390 / A12253. 1 / ISP 5477) TaxID=1933 RepID=A0ABT1HVS3_STRSD|nr:alpha/beta hydrolase [Streptoalloteichus tenebrarius]MCP2259596.1 Pimeloyl-ACP methyl ester carboxylesterase [Streptoalloteichus tenebrarius]BFF00997.1 alpha/beta hydrolase [Streptoalloteichus tenebrarius]
MSTTPSQITPHRATRVDVPARWGPLAALHAPAVGGGTGSGGKGADGADHDALVVFLPGYTGSKEDFAPLLDPVAESGFSVLALDLPGQHESAGPSDEADYLPDPLGRALAEVLTALANGQGVAGSRQPRPVLLVGHSYGGLVARSAVLAGAPVHGLVLLDSGPAALPDGDRRRLLDLGEPLLRAHGVEAVQRIREAQDANDPRWAERPAELKELLRRRFVESVPAGLLGMATGLRSEPDRVSALADALRERAIPCAVVCGEHDDAWAVETQRAMAERLGADFTVLPGAAHSPNIEAPEALLATLLPTWRAWLTR